MSFAHLVAVLVALVSVASAQDAVWVVDFVPGPGVDFSSITAAVAAAAEGDTILVHSGSYGSFGVNGKSLAITAEAGQTASVHGGVFIVGLQPDQAVSLQGLVLLGDPFSAGLNLSNNDGSVWVLDCELSGFDVSPPTLFESGTNALWITDCASVVAKGCIVTGGSSVAGEAAVRADTSNVHLFGSVLKGGAAHCEVFGPTTDCGSAGPAAVVSSGFLSAQKCDFTGGAAAPGAELCLPLVGCSCVLLAEGGLALSLGLGTPEAQLYDVTLSAGEAMAPCGLSGSQVTEVLTGTVASTVGPSLTMDLDTPEATGDVGTLALTGKPGDLVVVLAGFSPIDAWLPGWNGPLLIGDSTLVFTLGLLPASGNLVLLVQGPPLPAGIESVEVLVQAARKSTAGTLLANPARAVLLDASF
jgi:hypothetical protein